MIVEPRGVETDYAAARFPCFDVSHPTVIALCLHAFEHEPSGYQARILPDCNDFVRWPLLRAGCPECCAGNFYEAEHVLAARQFWGWGRAPQVTCPFSPTLTPDHGQNDQSCRRATQLDSWRVRNPGVREQYLSTRTAEATSCLFAQQQRTTAKRFGTDTRGSSKICG